MIAQLLQVAADGFVEAADGVHLLVEFGFLLA
jgi:hypothetical protein